MHPVRPQTGAPEFVIGEDQPEYDPLPAVALPAYGYPGAQLVLTRWRPIDEERAAIAAGGDVYIAELTYDGEIAPLVVSGEFEPWMLPVPEVHSATECCPEGCENPAACPQVERVRVDYAALLGLPPGVDLPSSTPPLSLTDPASYDDYVPAAPVEELRGLAALDLILDDSNGPAAE